MGLCNSCSLPGLWLIYTHAPADGREKDEHTGEWTDGRTDEREEEKRTRCGTPLLPTPYKSSQWWLSLSYPRPLLRHTYRQFSREREINTQHAQQLLLFERARALTKWPIMMMMVALFFLACWLLTKKKKKKIERSNQSVNKRRHAWDKNNNNTVVSSACCWPEETKQNNNKQVEHRKIGEHSGKVFRSSSFLRKSSFFSRRVSRNVLVLFQKSRSII